MSLKRRVKRIEKRRRPDLAFYGVVIQNRDGSVDYRGKTYSSWDDLPFGPDDVREGAGVLVVPDTMTDAEWEQAVQKYERRR